MSSTQELIAAVREAAEGTPYVVEERPYGFNVTIDVVDAQWWTLLRKSGVKKVFTYEVRTNERTKKMSITDVSNSLRWSAGGGVSSMPSLHAEKSFQRGRVYQYNFQKGSASTPARASSAPRSATPSAPTPGATSSATPPPAPAGPRR